MSRLVVASVAAALALMAAPAVSMAAAPANDNFAGAVPLAVGQTISASDLDATAEATEPTPGAGSVLGNGCGSPADGPHCTTSVWYSFTPDSTGSYTLETCDEGTDLDTVLAVYTGATLPGLIQTAANDDACAGGYGGNGSRVTFSGTSGNTYYVEVTGYSDADGSFYLRAYPAGSPPALEPDSLVDRYSSFLSAKLNNQGIGAASGSRHSASFSFSSDQAGATFQCSLDGGAFAACSSPASYDIAAGGDHAFAVRAVVSGTPDPTPAIQRFNVDATPPDTGLASGPAGGAVATPTVTWQSASSEYMYDPAFACGFDGSPATDCGASTTVSSLCNGAHTFTTAAKDRAFNVDGSPLSAAITETGGTACAAPTISPPSANNVSATDEDVQALANPSGSGGTATFQYGTTAAYGSTVQVGVAPNDTGVGTRLQALQPSTTYHYDITLTTPQGSVSTGDATFTTNAGTQPLVSAGAAVVVGHHAIAVPVTIGARPTSATYGVLVAPTGPATQSSPDVFSPAFLSGASASDTPGVVDVVDLDPGTYHVRPMVFWSNTESAVGNDQVVVVPPIAAPVPPVTPPTPPPVKPKAHFKLKSSYVSIAKTKHSSKTITITVRHLPAHTKLTLRLTIGKGHATITKTSRAGGTVKIKVKLSKKLRTALRSHKVKKVSVKVTAKPSGDTSSSVTKSATVRKR